jgi:hypothetical protein
MLLWIAWKYRSRHGLQGERVDRANQFYNKQWGGGGNHDNAGQQVIGLRLGNVHN